MNHLPIPFVRGPGAALLVLAVLLALPVEATSQEPTDSLRVEVERLAALVDSLRREIERLGGSDGPEQPDDALARLRAAAADAADAADADGAQPGSDGQEQFVGQQRSLQALNPEISLNADVMAHFDPDDTDKDNFFPREFELSFQSALDPFSRAALFISRHGEGPEVVPFAEPGGVSGPAHGSEEGGGGGFDVEEGYVEWVSLPGGVGFKLGKFYQRFGTLNRWHAHALPFQSRSLPHIAFFGEESLAQTGASLSWLAPFGGGAAGTYEVTFEAARAENQTLWGEASSPSYLTHVNGFWQLSSSVDFELNGSWLNGNFKDADGSFGRSVYGIETAFNWIPPARSRQTGLTIRGGYMWLTGFEDATRDAVDGFWSMAELRLSQNWLVGARFDRVRNPAAPDVTQWLASPTLTWWQSEFVRIRAEYDFLSGIEGGDGHGMFILQATFAMGPHRHATY